MYFFKEPCTVPYCCCTDSWSCSAIVFTLGIAWFTQEPVPLLIKKSLRFCCKVRLPKAIQIQKMLKQITGKCLYVLEDCIHNTVSSLIKGGLFQVYLDRNCSKP